MTTAPRTLTEPAPARSGVDVAAIIRAADAARALYTPPAPAPPPPRPGAAPGQPDRAAGAPDTPESGRRAAATGPVAAGRRP
ncbi:hypothetical protein NX801_17880 [Streptomyces sp. LP05-1]|uniref:Uncharacterized protein n=1 Tax=Streptomyces pyxinae TaxID=2970734 RepID=A0ABT2CLC5_9ACTN|nr:hypothetical protein [Streptomyces sp. LP05-1]MCS0637501.1 hypothetical protein [Streptomyces sp. LP05-1]